MNFNYDLLAFETLMFIYISFSAVLWGASHILRFIR